MAWFGTDETKPGVAFRTKSSTASLASQNALSGVGAIRPTFVCHSPMTTGSRAVLTTEPLPTNQLPHLPSVPSLTTHITQPGNASDMTTLAPSSVAALPPALTPSQRGELELARARAERAAAGRARGPSSGAFITAPAAANTDPGSGAAPKRPRGVGSGGGGDASVVNSDDDDGVEHSDGELELSRLSPEEQERVLTARLARGWGSANHKDARRLKRLLRNRVSAQQARERKKQYVNSLEEQIREQETHISLLEKRLGDFESQNEALRNIIMTMRAFAGNPPLAATAAAEVGAHSGGPTGRSTGGAARPAAAAAVTRTAHDSHGGSAAALMPGQQGAGTFVPGGRGISGTITPPPAQPEHSEQVVPELCPLLHQFPSNDVVRHEAWQQQQQLTRQEHQQQQRQRQRQRQAPAARQSRAQLLAMPPDIDMAVVASATEKDLTLGGHLQPALATTPGVTVAEVAAPIWVSPRSLHAPPFQEQLRCPTPLLGQPPLEVLETGTGTYLSYGHGMGDDDEVPHCGEVPTCQDLPA